MPTVLENLYSRLDLWYNEPLRSTIMKFDLHCHIKGGSIDSSIDIDEYVNILRSKGFGGMLVTDHDSYKALMPGKAKARNTTLHSSQRH